MKPIASKVAMTNNHRLPAPHTEDRTGVPHDVEMEKIGDNGYRFIGFNNMERPPFGDQVGRGSGDGYNPEKKMGRDVLPRTFCGCIRCRFIGHKKSFPGKWGECPDPISSRLAIDIFFRFANVIDRVLGPRF
jgi:hypothetical protein